MGLLEAIATAFVSAALGKITTMLLAFAAVHLALAWWDRRSGISFQAKMGCLLHDPRALGQYLGNRVLALCILGGAVLAFA